MIDVKLIKKPKGNARSTSGGGIAAGSNGYIGGSVREAVHAALADYATNAQQANEAMHAASAHDLDEDSPARDQFLSSIADDIAEGKITFQQGLEALALGSFKDGAEFGAFIRSLYEGTGAGIDAQGNAEFESVRVRSYFEAVELIINRLSAIEGDLILTEADTIESVTANTDGTYTLKLRSKWDGYFTAQAVNNVLKGIINTLAEGSGVFYTSWMRVNSVNPTLNTITVALYPDSETPSGKNCSPCELMKIARWGNQTDKTRQSCLYLSSTEGRIVKLTGVTKPKIGPENYGATFGKTPEFQEQRPPYQRGAGLSLCPRRCGAGLHTDRLSGQTAHHLCGPRSLERF